MRDLNTRQQCLAEATAFLESRLPPGADIGIVAGTGLGALVDGMSVDQAIPYEAIPNFPVSTVQSHSGRLLDGALNGRRVLVLQGRVHLYEGYSAWEVSFALRTLLMGCGVRTVILTNAAGGLDPAFAAGDLMLIRDHVNMLGANPLIGPHDPAWGPRFPDLAAAYDAGLRDVARRAAQALGLTLREGVYAAVPGPSLETPAETRFLRLAGADAVGMSTVPEVIVARQAGARVLGVSTITNMNIPETMAPTSLDQVIATAAAAAPRLAALIGRVVAEI